MILNSILLLHLWLLRYAHCFCDAGEENTTERAIKMALTEAVIKEAKKHIGDVILDFEENLVDKIDVDEKGELNIRQNNDSQKEKDLQQENLEIEYEEESQIEDENLNEDLPESPE